MALVVRSTWGTPRHDHTYTRYNHHRQGMIRQGKRCKLPLDPLQIQVQIHQNNITLYLHLSSNNLLDSRHRQTIF